MIPNSSNIFRVFQDLRNHFNVIGPSPKSELAIINVEPGKPSKDCQSYKGLMAGVLRIK